MLSPKLIVSPIDFSLPFIPESLTSLAHTPIYATLSAEERLAYNQTFALYVNEQTAYFEQTLSDFMLAIANLKEARHLRSQVLQIVVEEQRHASGFLSFNRRLRPDLYAEDQATGGGANPAASGEHVRNIPHGKCIPDGKCAFVRPHPVVSRLVGGLLRFPKLFPFPLWVMMLLEERSLFYTALSNQQSHLLEPNFVRLNQLHAEDEDHHVAVDEQLISLLWDSLPWPLKRLNAWLLGKVFSEYLYYPKRAALEILRVCFSGHPKLALMSQQVLELRHNRQYLANLYNRTTNPKTLAMMDSRPELAAMAQMMEGYLMTYPRATLLINFWPLVHVLSVLALWRTPALALLTLYLLPPLLARLVMIVLGKPEGVFPVRSRAFLVWWSLASLQSIFLRLPFLEELLRMVPTLYSNWLRLWGSRIGKNVYWAPGTVVVDRSYLDIGHQVVMGLSCSFNPHYISHEQLTLAPVTVGDNSQVGGQSVMMSGCEVGPNGYSIATLRMRPFSRFVEGKLWRAPRVSDDQEG